MSDWAIEATGLGKRYGDRVALDGLELHVPRVGVHALIGPNASGKTTTIRAALGLTHLQAGELRLLGHPVPRALPAALARVGAIVEQPRFTGSFSGRKNLRLLAAAGGLPVARVDEALEAVGLRGREGERYASYSLGLRQRIAVAACLLKQPDLVILDEPTNGLDPQGVSEVIALMARLRDSGRAVLVSSHHLPELARVADTVTVIAAGRTIAEASVADLIDQYGRPGFRVRLERPDDAARAVDVLAGHGWSVAPGAGFLDVSGPWEPARITRQLAADGLWVSGLERATDGLQDAYLSLTGATATGAPTTGAPTPEDLA